MGKKFVPILLTLFITACASSSPAPTATPLPSETSAPTKTLTPTPSATATNTPTPFPTPTPPVIWENVPSNIEGVFFEGENTYWFTASKSEERIEIAEIPSSRSFELSVFSNYSDLLAYWLPKETGAELWLSDLGFTKQQLIYVHSDDKYNGSLEWSADDRHLFAIPGQYTKSEIGLHYDVAAEQIFSWEFAYSHLAMSPKTLKIATWCSSITGKSEYAVLEWGGDIWYSSTAPETVFAEEPRNWSWSSDGERIAFFDIRSPNGELALIDNEGNILYRTSFTVDYDSTYDNVGHVLTILHIIQWSANNERILVLANETGARTCPNLGDEEGEREVPCWHILDANTGSLLWNLGDHIFADPNNLYYYAQSLSADGTLLYLSYGIPWLDGACGFTVIDLDEGTAGDLNNLDWEGFFCVLNMRWGSTP